MSIDFTWTPPKGLIPYPDERKARGDIILLLRKHYSEDGHETGTGQDIHNPHADSPTQSASERIGPEPDWSESDRDEHKRLSDVGDDDGSSAIYDRNRQIKNQWTADVRRALSLGELTNEEARALGYYGHGHDQSNNGLNWQPLPDTLYHVTTASTAVASDRLKSRDELNQDRGKGLGGGESSSISFTADPEIAQGIKRAMVEAQQVARGEKTIEHMVAEAKEGGFYDEMLKYWNGSEDPLNRIAQGPERQTRNLPKPDMSTDDINNYLKRSDWIPDRMVEAKDGSRTAIRSVAWTQTKDEWLSSVFDVYKTFSTFREWSGGAMDPLFFSSDVAGLAKIDTSEIGIVQVRPRPGAQGYQLGALGEWRTTTGEAVEIVDIK